MKAHGDEGGGRILLGDNTGGGRSGSSVFGVWISTGLPCIYMYSWSHVYKHSAAYVILVVTYRKVRLKSNFAQAGIEYTHSNHTCTYKGDQFVHKFQHTGTWSATACVIAKQYSFATFVSMRFDSCTEKFDAFQNCYYSFLYFRKNCACQKLRNFKVRKSGSVYTVSYHRRLSS